MAYTRNPLFQFASNTTVGVAEAPIGAILYDNASNAFYEKIKDSAADTITAALSASDLIQINNNGGSAWNVNTEYKPGDFVTKTDNIGGETRHQEYIALIDNIGKDPFTATTDWLLYNVVKYLDKDITITVSSGPGGSAGDGDFDTLEGAILAANRYKMIDGASLGIQILSGHVITGPMYLSGLDMADVYIYTEFPDTVVEISSAGINTTTAGHAAVFSFNSCIAPMFGFNMHFTSPDIGKSDKAFLAVAAWRTSISFNGSAKDVAPQLKMDSIESGTGLIRLTGNSVFNGNDRLYSGGETCFRVGGGSKAQLVRASITDYGVGGVGYGLRVYQGAKVDIGGVPDVPPGTGTGGVVRQSASGALHGISVSNGGMVIASGIDANFTSTVGYDADPGPGTTNDLVVGAGSSLIWGGLPTDGSLGGTNISTNILAGAGIIYI